MGAEVDLHGAHSQQDISKLSTPLPALLLNETFVSVAIGCNTKHVYDNCSY